MGETQFDASRYHGDLKVDIVIKQCSGCHILRGMELTWTTIEEVMGSKEWSSLSTTGFKSFTFSEKFLKAPKVDMIKCAINLHE